MLVFMERDMNFYLRDRVNNSLLFGRSSGRRTAFHSRVECIGIGRDLLHTDDQVIKCGVSLGTKEGTHIALFPFIGPVPSVLVPDSMK